MPTATAKTRDRPRLMMDVEDLAALLDCSERHVYRMAETGKMPAPIRLGALVRWNQAVISAWIAAGCPAQSGGL
jgi:excisionase family DNA binding protein